MLKAVIKLAKLDAERRGYVCRAVGLLLAARVEHLLTRTKTILDRMQSTTAAQRHAPSPGQSSFNPELAAWAIETVARHVPWRSDCLLQAMAADRWLRNHGYRPEFHLGVARKDEGELCAHAWLTLDGKVVTGGAVDIGNYAPILSTTSQQREVEQR